MTNIGTSAIIAHPLHCIHVQSFLMWVRQCSLPWAYQKSVSLDFASTLQPAAVETGGESSSLSPCPGVLANHRHFMILSDGLLVADWFLERSSWRPLVRGSCLFRATWNRASKLSVSLQGRGDIAFLGSLAGLSRCRIPKRGPNQSVLITWRVDKVINTNRST